MMDKLKLEECYFKLQQTTAVLQFMHGAISEGDSVYSKDALDNALYLVLNSQWDVLEEIEKQLES